MRSDGTRRQRGFALVLVLWALAVMTVLALSYQHSVRNEIRITARLTQAAEARAIARAGVWLGVRALLDRTARGGELLAPLNEPFTEGVIALRFQDQEGLVDLNAAGADLLEATAKAAGADAPAARDLAAAIVALRGEGAGLAGAQPTPLRSVAALRALPGMTPALFARLRTFCTVHSGRYGIDPRVAPAALARAVTATALHIQTSRRLIAIASEGSQGGATQRIEAVVRLGGPVEQPFSLYAWREGILAEEED